MESDTEYEWMDDASCRGSTELFFGPPHEKLAAKQDREQAAKKVCETCVCIEECLDYAVKNKFRDGVYGGLDETELRRLIRNDGKKK